MRLRHPRVGPPPMPVSIRERAHVVSLDVQKLDIPKGRAMTRLMVAGHLLIESLRDRIQRPGGKGEAQRNPRRPSEAEKTHTTTQRPGKKLRQQTCRRRAVRCGRPSSTNPLNLADSRPHGAPA